MYKEILRSIAGIDTFPVISLLLFVTVFAIVLIRVFRMDARGAERFASIPLDDADVRATRREEGWQ